jgi:hypothetical protein
MYQKPLSIDWLKKEKACPEGMAWFEAQKETNGIKLVEALAKDHWEWANWLLVRLMTHKQQVQYAVYAAEQVIGIYEAKYSDDKRPRQAIDAAKKYVANPSKKNRAAARAAAEAAWAAAEAAWAAARAAAEAAWAAAEAAWAAAEAAWAAARAAAWAAAGAKMQEKIIKYGIGLVK